MERYLSAEEEAVLVTAACQRAQRMCQSFKPPLPAQTWVAAVAFVRRFYLHSTVMDYPPERVVPACVFLACKTEDVIVSMWAVAQVAVGREASGDEAAVDAMTAAIKSFELELCKGLQYHLVVYGPLRPLRGLLTLAAEELKPANVAELLQRTEALLAHWWLGDAMLLFAPSQLALAALLRVAGEMRLDLSRFVENLRPTNPDDHAPPVEHVGQIAETSVQLAPADKLQVTGLLDLEGVRQAGRRRLCVLGGDSDKEDLAIFSFLFSGFDSSCRNWNKC